MQANQEKSVIVKHSQVVRQSHNYNSAEATYGVEIPCENNKEAIKKAFAKAEQLVEDALASKISDQRELLAMLSDRTKK